MLEDFRLKVFMTVAEEGSFTLAAKSLGISQPAVSQNIAELERQAGTELFFRSRGAVTLTAAGIAFRDYADRILYWYEAASAMFGGKDRRAAGRTVRIAADACSLRCVLPRGLSFLHSANPDTRFVLDTSPSDEDLDVRIWSESCRGRMTLSESATLLGTLPASALVSRDAVLPDVVDLQGLPADFRLAVWAPYAKSLPPGLTSRIVFESSSFDMLQELAAAASDVVGLLPAMPLHGHLVPLPVSLVPFQRDIFMAPSESFSHTPLCSLLRQTLAENLSRI